MKMHERRPLGKVVVQAIRPPMRFGHDLYIGVDTTDGVYVAQVQDGELTWQLHIPGTEPAVHLDDEIAAELFRVVNTLPHPDDALNNHLHDTIKIRDRPLKLVEDHIS